MTWRGIRYDTTPVDDTPNTSELQYNTHFRVANELRRRVGYQNTSIAKQTGAILGIVSSNGVSGNFLTFDLGGSEQGFSTGGGGGIDVLQPQPPGPKKRRPKGDRGTCTIWGPFGDSGSASAGPLTFTLPASSCPGTVIFTSTEGGGSGGGSDYGYSAVITADGVPILTTGCLVNSGAGGVIPAGTLSVGYTVTAGCAGGSTPGSWLIQVTTP